MNNSFHKTSIFGGDDPLFMERIRALRAKLEYRFSALGVNAIAITSAVAGEGKTLLSVMLALEFCSGGGKEVLLVDLDLRKSGIEKTLEPGSTTRRLTDFLRGDASLKDVIQDSGFRGLHVVFGGTLAEPPTDILNSERMVHFLDEVKKRFDIVIVDTPPLIPVADTIVLKKILKTFLIVARAGSTPYPIMQQAMEELEEAQILGVVLNGVQREKASYYNRYYGKYYEQKSR